MTKAWLDLYAQFTDLSEEDKRQFFEAIKNDVDPEPKKETKLYEGIREARFRNGLSCVHCGSLRVKQKWNVSQTSTLLIQGLKEEFQR